jgi:hypothetical protein
MRRSGRRYQLADGGGQARELMREARAVLAGEQARERAGKRGSELFG